jgi:hypothetical protein
MESTIKQVFFFFFYLQIVIDPTRVDCVRDDCFYCIWVTILLIKTCLLRLRYRDNQLRARTKDSIIS